MTDHEAHDDRHDRGLQYDLETLWQRRRVLELFPGMSLAAVVGCSDDETPSAGAPTQQGATLTPTTFGSAAATPTVTPIPTTPTPLSACITIPGETAGPFPGDGSNGPNALTVSGIVRGDIRSSFGGSSATA